MAQEAGYVAFGSFWALYPRKTGKGACEPVWRRLKVTLELFETMKTALGWQCRTRQWQDPQFIPHPVTWLRQRRWEDEPDSPARSVQLAEPVETFTEWRDRLGREVQTARLALPMSDPSRRHGDE